MRKRNAELSTTFDPHRLIAVGAANARHAETIAALRPRARARVAAREQKNIHRNRRVPRAAAARESCRWTPPETPLACD